MANEELLTPSEFKLVIDDFQGFPSNFIDNNIQFFQDQGEMYESNETYESDFDSKSNLRKRKLMKKTLELGNDTIPNNVEMLPCLDPYAGELDFQLLLPADNTANRWTYSKSLKKVFIHIDKVLALNFKWNHTLKPDIELFVRAMPVYTSHDSLKNPVMRCPLHCLPDNPLNSGFEYLQHVLRCEHSSTTYVQDEITKRLSCVTPLFYPQAGCETTTLTYKFVCKTSCSRGMDRKPISVIFTLEDVNGLEYGRQQLAVKICSCPKRDKVKEENNELKKQSYSNSVDLPSNIPSLQNPNDFPNSQSELLGDTRLFYTNLPFGMDQINTNDRKRKQLEACRSAGKVKRIRDDETPLMEKVCEIMDFLKNEHNAIRERIEHHEKEIKEFFLRREDGKFGNFVETLLQGMPPQIAFELQNDILKLINEKKLEIIRQNMMSNCLTPESSVVSPGFVIPADWPLN